MLVTNCETFVKISKKMLRVKFFHLSLSKQQIECVMKMHQIFSQSLCTTFAKTNFNSMIKHEIWCYVMKINVNFFFRWCDSFAMKLKIFQHLIKNWTILHFNAQFAIATLHDYFTKNTWISVSKKRFVKIIEKKMQKKNELNVIIRVLFNADLTHKCQKKHQHFMTLLSFAFFFLATNFKQKSSNKNQINFEMWQTQSQIITIFVNNNLCECISACISEQNV